ncbi:ATP-binding protein [Lyngbya confervoides]|uniref:ATP-binding protein n=1 Tax=Lyngbya confervoides BDU141951 TaxID=1574623 RepID=A0ABD4T990_9CYAN|nr:ATP-binding protein [Lyngbya confervoides]MCM1985013.1 hypothetical protein [Lyngbya confervoides BDU141951]
MRVNPGGNLAPDEVVGRDRFIKKLWKILDRQSLVLTAERRMGKTSVIRKMYQELPTGKVAIFRDLEGCKTALDFTRRVVEDAQDYLTLKQKGWKKLQEAAQAFEGFEIGGVVKIPERAAAHWKLILRQALEDLLDQRPEQIILFWDELPLMVYDIRRQEGEQVAEEILDELRAIRQTYGHKVRMVFTGSIGLHNVLTKLKRSGYANDPTNDMKTVDVPPLAEADGVALAQALIAGEQISLTEVERWAREIAIAADYIPFFIHQMVGHLADEVEDFGGVTTDAIVRHYLLDPDDPWHLRYFQERIETYYPDSEKYLALAVLDVLAVEDQPLSFRELYNRVLTKTEAFDEETTRAMVTMLMRDHYIELPEVNAHRFRFSLIRNSWKVHRGLG